MLLCTLNREIDNIRKEFQADKKDGTAYALDILSKAVGNGCTQVRVKKRLDYLWQKAGPSRGEDATKENNLLFVTGAWTRSLPSLDALYADMLEELALASKVQNG